MPKIMDSERAFLFGLGGVTGGAFFSSFFPAFPFTGYAAFVSTLCVGYWGSRRLKENIEIKRDCRGAEDKQ